MRNQNDQYELIEPAFEPIPQLSGLSTSYHLTDLNLKKRNKVHHYVLFNCDITKSYIRWSLSLIYFSLLRKKYPIILKFVPYVANTKRS